MVTRPVVFVIICFGFIILLHSLVPKVMAQQRSTKMNQLMSHDERTRKRKSYILQMARDNKILRDNDNVGIYETEPLRSDVNPEELSSFMADYANLIRNDIVLLDDLVETKTKKRSDIKINRPDVTIADTPCTCEYINDHIDLGENSYPRYVETRICKKERQNGCLPPYICKQYEYSITVMKRRGDHRRESQRQDTLVLPDDLSHKWIAVKQPISVGCVCARDYIVEHRAMD